MTAFSRLTCRRTAGAVDCEGLPQRVIHHSPTGYEWGYGGSGPADLALNILAALLPVNAREEEPVRLWAGACVSRAAWQFHQHLKWEFIADLPRAGFTLSRKDVRDWINTPDSGERRALCLRIIEREELHALAETAGVSW